MKTVNEAKLKQITCIIGPVENKDFFFLYIMDTIWVRQSDIASTVEHIQLSTTSQKN